MVSVVIIASTLSASILSAHINSLQDLNEEEYFKAISEYIVSDRGTPPDWGSYKNLIPDTLGLAKNDSLYPNELDSDKIGRLNPQNTFALMYTDILSAARLKNIAIGISVSQLMNIAITLTSNSTLANATAYTFRVQVNQDGTPQMTYLHYYVIAKNFLSDAYNSTSSDGTSNLNVEIPNPSNGTASLVVFTRASHDPRITAYAVYSFGHLSPEPSPNGTFLNLSPLNDTLYASSNSSDMTFQKGYAFSYGYQFNLTLASNTTYALPTISETSPTVLAMSGSNASDFFIEWTAYPQIPLEVGSNFQNSESHSFSYMVTIKKTFYKLTLRFGGINQ